MSEKEMQLRQAAAEGNVEDVSRLLQQGIKQTPHQDSGDTPLHGGTSCYITEPRYVEVVRLLIEYNGDVNAANKFGDTPVHNAASNGNPEIIELLLNAGGHVHTEGESKMVPLGLAAMKRHHAVVNSLVKKLAQDDSFSKKQVEWMNSTENETQQLHVFRAISAIFNEKRALEELLRYDVINVILEGMKRFTKKSIQTNGLQLLHSVQAVQQGVERSRQADVKSRAIESCKTHENDAVVQHLLQQVVENL